MDVSMCIKIKMKLAANKMTQKDLHAKLVEQGYKVSYNQLRQYLNELIVTEKAEYIIRACAKILKEIERSNVNASPMSVAESEI